MFSFRGAQETITTNKMQTELLPLHANPSPKMKRPVQFQKPPPSHNRSFPHSLRQLQGGRIWLYDCISIWIGGPPDGLIEEVLSSSDYMLVGGHAMAKLTLDLGFRSYMVLHYFTSCSHSEREDSEPSLDCEDIL